MSTERPEQPSILPPAITLGNQVQKAQLGPWSVEMSPGQRYLYIEHTEHPGDIHVKADIEGYVVDVWNGNKDAASVQASLAIEYIDLRPDEYVEPSAASSEAPPAEAVTEPVAAPPKSRFVIVEFAGDCGEEMDEMADSVSKFLTLAEVNYTKVHVDNELGPELLHSLRMGLS